MAVACCSCKFWQVFWIQMVQGTHHAIALHAGVLQQGQSQGRNRAHLVVMGCVRGSTTRRAHEAQRESMKRTYTLTEQDLEDAVVHWLSTKHGVNPENLIVALKTNGDTPAGGQFEPKEPIKIWAVADETEPEPRRYSGDR